LALQKQKVKNSDFDEAVSAISATECFVILKLYLQSDYLQEDVPLNSNNIIGNEYVFL
jgi:hypothetical protein